MNLIQVTTIYYGKNGVEWSHTSWVKSPLIPRLLAKGVHDTPMGQCEFVVL